MDSLWKCNYGIDLNIQNQPHNDFFEASEKIFSDAHKFHFLKILSSIYVFLFFKFFLLFLIF